MTDLKITWKNTAESNWAAIQDSKERVRSHYVLIGFTAPADYTYRVYCTLSDNSRTLASSRGHFTALPDLDGDGLHDAEEDYGWMVYVDLNGDGDTRDSYEHFHVSSSRDTYDSDWDGLNDAQEKNLRTNPNYYDTDWDGLTDKYEVTTVWDSNTAGYYL